MGFIVLKGKRYSYAYSENEVDGTRISKHHREFASFEKTLERYYDAGVTLLVNRHPCTARQAAYFCMKHDSLDYMPDCICDEGGQLREIHFNLLKKK